MNTDLNFVSTYLNKGKEMNSENSVYYEDNVDEFGVANIWPYNKIDTIQTKRDTKVEIVDKPKWGLTCYMNNSVQSCLKDEQMYHESLVVPVMSTVENPKRVCIIGGGEGATLREVLKWPGVEEVDMYEWDREVVELFRTKYTQWSQGAFNDPRVVLIYDDIFDVIHEKPNKKYDVIIIDLFDPDSDNYDLWKELLINITNRWINDNGSIVMYSGMRNILADIQPYQVLMKFLNMHIGLTELMNVHTNPVCHNIIPYKVYIPSFSGESTFILIKNDKSSTSINTVVKSHLTDKIWESYKTFNW